MDEIDQLLAGIDPKIPAQKPITPKPAATGAIANLLTEVKQAQAEIAEADRLRQAEIEREQAHQAKIKQQRLEQLRSQRREALRQTAAQWLKQLKPKSDEGRWFEEFACNYESRLEAAIDYLEALEEVNALHPDR
ncbi:MAG: hypothetical protein RLZZ511_921 [Cyanobacteriota bacterium]|jgi:response regulator of citrate/malate metabolism